jgi:hypothetical protein
MLSLGPVQRDPPRGWDVRLRTNQLGICPTLRLEPARPRLRSSSDRISDRPVGRRLSQKRSVRRTRYRSENIGAHGWKSLGEGVHAFWAKSQKVFENLLWWVLCHTLYPLSNDLTLRKTRLCFQGNKREWCLSLKVKTLKLDFIFRKLEESDARPKHLTLGSSKHRTLQPSWRGRTQKDEKIFYLKTSDFEYTVKLNDHPRDPKNWSLYKRCLLDKGWWMILAMLRIQAGSCW